MGCSVVKGESEYQRGLAVFRQYEFKRLRGKGATSQVHEAMNKQTGIHCAVKCIVTKEAEELGRLHEYQIAEQVWGILDHPNVCKLHATYQDQELQYFVMELMEGPTFFQRLEDQIVLMEDEAGRTGYQMMSAVAYMHTMNICHRDLKPESWLLSDWTPQAKVKLIDFGLAKTCREDNLTLPCGTLHYLAPEVLRGLYGKAADVWTLGVVIFLTMYADYPFDGESCCSVMQNILSAQPDWSDSCYSLSQDARDLLHQLLVKDKDLRPTAAKVLKHPWFGTRQRFSTVGNVVGDDIKSRLKQARASVAKGVRKSEIVDEQMVRRMSVAVVEPSQLIAMGGENVRAAFMDSRPASNLSITPSMATSMSINTQVSSGIIAPRPPGIAGLKPVLPCVPSSDTE